MWLFCLRDWFQISSCCDDERSEHALACLVVTASANLFCGDEPHSSVSVAVFADGEAERSLLRDARNRRRFFGPCAEPWRVSSAAALVSNRGHDLPADTRRRARRAPRRDRA